MRGNPGIRTGVLEVAASETTHTAAVERPHNVNNEAVKTSFKYRQTELHNVKYCLSLRVGKQVLPNVGNNAAKRAHDHRQFLAGHPRLRTVLIIAQGVHTGHPALVVLATNQHY